MGLFIGGEWAEMRAKGSEKQGTASEPSEIISIVPKIVGPVWLDTKPSAFYDGLAEVSCALYKHSLTVLPPDVRTALIAATGRETDHQGRSRLNVMVNAINTSDRTGIIVCQDTGVPVFFLHLGTEFHVNGARLKEAMANGITLATQRFSLRSSVVHPLSRFNPQTGIGDGVPIFHTEFIDGADWLDMLLVPKGSGSENMSFLAMLSPAEGINGVKRFVYESVVSAGAKPCPPTIVGVGLGGTADECMALAKKAIARPVGQSHPEEDIAALERQLCEALNVSGIGPQGLGGLVTSFAVHIEYAYTHISMNPVAVNIQCWRGERARARVFADGKVEYGY